MINKLFSNFDSVIYIQIWESRIKVTNIETSKTYDEKPLLATSLNKRGAKIIEAIGNDAFLKTGSDIEVINPFNKERPLVTDLGVGQKLLQHIIGLLLKKGIFKLRPRAIVHPMEKLDFDLTIEDINIFKKLAIGAGAREAIVYQGPALSIHGFNYNSVKSNL